MNFKIFLFTMIFTLPVWASSPHEASPEAHPTAEPSAGVVSDPRPPAHQMVIREIPTDFRVPAKLWDQLLSHTAVKEMQIAEEGREDEQQGSNILFAPLRVRLTEKNPGVLIKPAIEFVFPRGGGQIDLSKVTTGQAGTFFVQFDLGASISDLTFEAFHLSKARKRRHQGRIFGGGCRSFTKITSVLRQAGPQGLPFNTTQDLHLSALGGNFLFSWATADAITVTQVRFFDSEKPKLNCEGE